MTLPAAGTMTNGAPALRNIDDHLSVQAIIRSYQVRLVKEIKVKEGDKISFVREGNRKSVFDKHTK